MYCPCHTTLNPLCYLKCSNQRSTMYSTDTMIDRQSIHMPSNLLSPALNCLNHRPTMQTQRQACNPTPVTVIKGSIPSDFFSPIFPVNYHSTERWKTAHLSSLRATTTWGFDCKIIWKAWGSGFWGWFPVACKGIQMAAFKS